MSKFLILFSLFISGCATNPVSTSSAENVKVSGHGDFKTIIKRDSGLFGSACASSIYINGSKVGELFPAQSITHFSNNDRVLIAVKNEGFFCESDIVEVAASFYEQLATVRVAISSTKGLYVTNTAL
ncbi:hypothetical protein VSVS12_01953 [Vibrio scophthalmi]|uniref:hypothetical protein n=1 Tax=Vibrio scophthalmi TaxID=45658 RepID=UPI0008091B85|nr:hypothetical protein [Vibrio scophthalmi]ANS85719.1 hypothetical protein VSVS12_01953 [Vibrio scophthalmi]